jgi:DNA-binding beta-propeller fold protein YncE
MVRKRIGMKVSIVAAILVFLITTSSFAVPSGSFTLVASIPLPGVEGRIDHLTIDLTGNRLFVAALGNNSVEVIGLGTNSVLRSLRSFSEPQGVAYVSDLNRLYVTNAGSGECDVIDGSSYGVLRRMDLGGDADSLHDDPSAHRVLISAGNSLVILDATGNTQAGTIGLPGHPEGFVLEQHGPQVFVNVPVPSRSVFVIDRSRGAVTHRWPIGGILSNAFSNFPIALDEGDGMLFVGTREPPSLKVLDVSTGKDVGDMKIDGDADDIWYDADRKRIYVSCGAGFIDIFQQEDSRHFAEAGRIATAAGGRTSLWVPELSRLFVAIPHRGSQAAEIRIYAAD